MGTPEQHGLGQRVGADGGAAQRCGGARALYYWDPCLVCTVSNLLKY